jgi:hypothetical protein
MSEHPDPGHPCTVHPTAELSPTTHYSDTAMTALFTAHVLLFNQEVAGLWQRYTSMLLANAVLFSVFALRDHRTNQEVVITLVLGLALCTAWGVITWTGSAYQRIWIEAAERFTWGEPDAAARPVNPFRYFHVARQQQRRPRLLTRVALAAVVLIFCLSYIALACARYQ